MKTISKMITRVFAVCGLGLLSGSAGATVSISAPEPSIASLLGLAGVVVAAMAIRKRRK